MDSEKEEVKEMGQCSSCFDGGQSKYPGQGDVIGTDDKLTPLNKESEDEKRQKRLQALAERNTRKNGPKNKKKRTSLAKKVLEERKKAVESVQAKEDAEKMKQKEKEKIKKVGTERNEKTKQVAEAAQKRINGGGNQGNLSAEKLKELREKRIKDELMGKVIGMYSKLGKNPPFGIGSLSRQKMEDHLKYLNKELEKKNAEAN
eukprot:maker-scaffold_12-snap-gene-1.52-mRNA-1 protein AED:0.00 eAED:0.00 QI:27/1/1/1/1/1/4/145/202